MQRIIALCKWTGGDGSAYFKSHMLLVNNLCAQLKEISDHGFTMPGEDRVIKVKFYECHDFAQLCHQFDDIISPLRTDCDPFSTQLQIPKSGEKGEIESGAVLTWPGDTLATFAQRWARATPGRNGVDELRRLNAGFTLRDDEPIPTGTSLTVMRDTSVHSFREQVRGEARIRRGGGAVQSDRI